MTLPRSAAAAATHGGTNAAVALLLGAYLAIVLYQGNLGALATQAKTDFLGGATGTGATQPGFWKWGAAVLILMALAQINAVKPVFGPILAITLVAMLINIASENPQALSNLESGVQSFFSPATSQGAPAPPASGTTTGTAAGTSTGSSSAIGSAAGSPFAGLLGGSGGSGLTSAIGRIGNTGTGSTSGLLNTGTVSGGGLTTLGTAY